MGRIILFMTFSLWKPISLSNLFTSLMQAPGWLRLVQAQYPQCLKEFLAQSHTQYMY